VRLNMNDLTAFIVGTWLAWMLVEFVAQAVAR
jgi:hypothetical protein